MQIEQLDINQLKLDPKNDRFAELYSGSENERDLIEYLLYDEAAEEVAKNILLRKQFYPDEPLWVIADGQNYLVKDGNRRCAAVKALQNPQNYGLTMPSMNFEKLPVLIYKDAAELDKRIQEQHTHSLFRQWDRIAKALKAFEMKHAGSSEDELREIGPNPAALLKTANFYYEAVKVGGEELKQLLRGGRSKDTGKTIIFERLFSYARQCGYSFKGKPNYTLEVNDRPAFESYIRATIAYLQDNPKTTHKYVDDKKAAFLNELSGYGFTPAAVSKPTPTPSPKPEPTPGSDPPAEALGTLPPVTHDPPVITPPATVTEDESFALRIASSPGRRFRAASSDEALQIIRVIASRFYAIDAKLCLGARHARPPLIINDEHDAQYVLEALLQLFFDNVKPEEWTPSYLGSSKRVDFFLPEFKLVIEVKMASAKLRDKQLSQQLVEDLVHYSKMPECKTLVCFIYNPNKSLKQPSVLKADLEKRTVVNIDKVVALIEPQ